MANKNDNLESNISLLEEMLARLSADEKAELFVKLAYKLHLEHLLHPDICLDQEKFVDLPSLAPELYRNRKNRTEKPADFIHRVYAPWLGKGLARPHLMALDRPLYDALHNWLRKNPMPEDLVLPTKKQMIDAELKAARIEPGEGLAFPSDSTLFQKRRRLYNAARNRARKG